MIQIIRDFFALYRLYRRVHNPRYAVQRAFDIAFGRVPF